MSLPQLKIPFVKACACGNDFLLIDASTVEDAEFAAKKSAAKAARTASKKNAADLASLTRRICDRHQGVGADGVEWLYPHASADVEIRLINADGSKAEISGNGTRCVAAYLCEERGKERITIQTGAGLKTCVLIGRTDSDYEFEADMGEADVQSELTLKLNARKIRGIPVSMGNPHYVVFVREFPENWQNEAAAIQRDAVFKQGVNVEFVKVDGKHDVSVRFFERGVGETQSSGTGSCASAVAAMSSGPPESPVRVHTPGGIQTVRREGRRVYLRGLARLVCRGEFLMS